MRRIQARPRYVLDAAVSAPLVEVKREFPMFKKLIQATIAASLVATPMIAASAEAQQRQVTTTTVQQRNNGTVVRQTTVKRQQVNNRQVNNRQVNNRQFNNRQQANQRQWRKGQRFDRRYAQNYRSIDYRQYRNQRLYAPARGQQWVRSGNDAVLINGSNGLIAAVLAGVLR